MLTKNALEILEQRYLLKSRKGTVIETPDQLFKRVAEHVAKAESKDREKWKTAFYSLMQRLEFLPNSPTLMNAGLPHGQLSACFVLPVEDNLRAIFNTLKNAALIHQSGGGTGFNFSKLRPKGDRVSSSGGKTSGPIAFMKVYDAATEHVKQGGKRRGANMGILNVNHPDIEEFIAVKSKGNTLRNFNLSVGITDSFMQAVEKDDDWDLINPRTNTIQKTVKAVGLWKMIVKNAWETGDPGLVFLDTINKNNPTPKLGSIWSTNPCGEVPLLEYESCNLGSLNLTKFVALDNGQADIDWAKLGAAIPVAIRFLDNVITVNHYLLPEIKTISTNNRKVGLGVMGWAELLILLRIPYASKEAVALGEKLMAFIATESYSASSALAKERGSFPNWRKSGWAPNHPLRNATCNSIAPTGTISVIANASYSIEPLYALAFKRVGILNGKEQTEVNSLFKQEMEKLGLWTDSLLEQITESESIQQITAIPGETKKLFQTSLEIPWKYHLLHQQAFQKHTDNAVSKTINLPEETSIQQVANIYRTAWELGLKGITIYRNGSKENQILQKCSLNGATFC